MDDAGGAVGVSPTGDACGLDLDELQHDYETGAEPVAVLRERYGLTEYGFRKLRERGGWRRRKQSARPGRLQGQAIRTAQAMTLRLAGIVAIEITRIEEQQQAGSLPQDDIRRLPELARAVEQIMKPKANGVGRKRNARVDRETKSNDGPVQTDDIFRIRAEVERRIDRLAETGGLAGDLREGDGDGSSIRQ